MANTFLAGPARAASCPALMPFNGMLSLVGPGPGPLVVSAFELAPATCGVSFTTQGVLRKF
ncbi:MAG: hypothetical protein CMJ21_05300 [Phycisphaerae bacterium]|nr:hypothetical protein [Phycisphaerae bacterium]